MHWAEVPYVPLDICREVFRPVVKVKIIPGMLCGGEIFNKNLLIQFAAYLLTNQNCKSTIPRKKRCHCFRVSKCIFCGTGGARFMQPLTQDSYHLELLLQVRERARTRAGGTAAVHSSPPSPPTPSRTTSPPSMRTSATSCRSRSSGTG